MKGSIACTIAAAATTDAMGKSLLFYLATLKAVGTDLPFCDAAYARRALAELNVDPGVRQRVAWDNAAALL